MKESTMSYQHTNGRTVTLHFRSWVARLLGRGHVNYGVTLSARHICIKEDWITAYHLAHEWGHTIEAEKRGIMYLPWVLLGYVRKGYSHSKAEVEADEFMEAYWREFRDVGTRPTPETGNV